MSRDALVVGINVYQNESLKNLTSPATDAEAIAQMLEKQGDFNVVRRLPEAIGNGNEPVVRQSLEVRLKELKQALVQLLKPVGKHIPDTALFYFSGHGLRNTLGISEGFLATSDTHPDFEFYGLSMNWLRQLLAESPIRQQVIWLDCCHSGQLLIHEANPGNSGLAKDRCFIASSREFEGSWSDLNSPYSVMTKALLEGLDPNRLQGRWIDTFALADYVDQQLQGELQTPICTNFGEAIRLTRSWQVDIDKPVETRADRGICPYKGLEFFDCNNEDPKYFFGRDALVDELLDKVRTSNFMALVGASGNGKSSALRAGLLHQLKIGRRITGSENWQIRITRPDKNPLENLALAFVDEELPDLDRAAAMGKTKGLLEEGAEGLKRLIQVSSAPRVILVIDQFEEVFTRCESREERETYLACLIGALAETEAKLCLIIAIRADFVGKCLEHEYSGLAQRVQENMISVLLMQAAELESSICQPANKVGLEVEQTLVTQMLNEIVGAPGSLPLLQYTLKELWQRREKNQLTLAAYQELGGITGTLDKRATEIYNGFETEAEKDTARHIFLKLTQLGEGTEDTRRRVLQSNLIAEPKYSAALIKKVIAKLADPDNRLIVTSEVTRKGIKSESQAIVDVAHEALIRNWRLLRKWLGENRDRLRQQRKIEASAEAWREQDENKGYLLQGLPLNEAKLFQKEHQKDFPLSDIARKFIRKSLRNRHIIRLKTASWLLIPALIFGVFIEIQYRETSVKQDYSIVSSNAGDSAERLATIDLVRGCKEQRLISLMNWPLLKYLSERLFGNCRELQNADLRDAYLYSADLSFAYFRDANFSNADLSVSKLLFADLRYTNLSSTNLHSTNLSFADLSFAYLRDANLSNANLSHANLSFISLIDVSLFSADLSNANLKDTAFHRSILLATDLRRAKNLTSEQLSGEGQPLLCNVAFPKNITDIDPNRDCDQLPQVLADRDDWYDWLLSLEDAQSMVSLAKVKVFEPLPEEE